jgi:hypothetical protein
MTLQINGVDITPYIKYQGFKWTRNDIDGPDAGRTMDALMHRERVATKIRLDISCKPLLTEEASIVLNAIWPEYVTVTYLDPMTGLTTKTMYSNNNPAAYCINKGDGREYWQGIEFPLVER